MLTDDEALAVLLGLLAGRRAGLVTTSAAATESATAKLRRVLPRRLGGGWTRCWRAGFTDARARAPPARRARAPGRRAPIGDECG